MNCRINEHYTGSFQIVKTTQASSPTVKHFLSALKCFYHCMIRNNKYLYANPLIDTNNIIDYGSLPSVRQNKSRLPEIAGTEEPINFRKFTNSYFKLVDNDWVPRIIDDITIPTKLLLAGEKLQWSLREQIIARLLFETGARVTEIIELQVGDFRARSSIREMSTFSKGSFKKRVKFISFSNDTAILLKRYFDTERKTIDKLHRNFDELDDEEPIFLSSRNTAYTYNAWYWHWRRACKYANINFNPHKARHWYVTQVIRFIHKTSKSDGEVKRKTRELVAYMDWKSKETLEVYEHYFDINRHLEVQEDFFNSLEQSVINYHNQKKINNVKATTINEASNINSTKIPYDQAIEKFLFELE